MRVATSVFIAGLCGSLASAQVITPEFAADYSLMSLGSAPGVPANYGGVVINLDDPNSLLLGGAANAPGAAIYTVSLSRDANGHIESWGCAETTVYSTSPHIDGGLSFNSADVLFYTGYPINSVGQILPGGGAPAKVTALRGVAASVGALAIVPEGFAGAGHLKLASYNAGFWYDAQLQPDGRGTYNIINVSAPINIGGGPEGIVYVKGGNPQFPVDSVLISEFGTGQIVTYAIDGNGDPLVATKRTFISGLGGAEGAALDPLTGDFIFATFGGGNQVVVVRGFTVSESCVGDIDASLEVDGADLGLLLGAWGDCEQCAEDLNGDCLVDGADLGVLLSKWGACSS
jgi:hypothetical protein